MKKSSQPLLIGAHTSASGGVHKALLQGSSIGATTIQLFTANQKQWHTNPISEEEVNLWNTSLKETGIKTIMSHASYLINLGSPDPELRQKSIHAMERELSRCHQLDLTFLNFHPGAYTKGNPDDCLDLIVKSLLKLESLAKKGSTRLLLETTAGQGTSMGHRFEHLQYIIDKVGKHISIGVCIDTCHIFVAGYDISTKAGWKKTLEEFDATIGLKHLYALHVNDSLKPLGSKSDRHASLGKGEIGIDSFKAMMELESLKLIPKYLETPNPDIWAQEIELLREFGHEI